MKYLKTYRLYESEVATDEEIISDIKNCFLEVSDMIEKSDNYGVKVNEFSKKRPKKVIRELNIKDVKYEVMIIPAIDQTTPVDNRYRPTNMSKDMLQEIENSVSLTTGTLGLKLKYAAVEWVNGFDYSKGETGPGMSIKRFAAGGITPTSDKFEKGSYNLDYLFDFLRLKGDKVRWIKIFFE